MAIVSREDIDKTRNYLISLECPLEDVEFLSGQRISYFVAPQKLNEALLDFAIAMINDQSGNLIDG